MYCQSIIFRNLKIMVLYTYQVSIYQGRIKRTSKKELLQKEFKRLFQYTWALDIPLLHLYWPIFIYIAIDQEAFASVSFFYKFTSTLKECTKYSKITSHSKATREWDNPSTGLLHRKDTQSSVCLCPSLGFFFL